MRIRRYSATVLALTLISGFGCESPQPESDVPEVVSELFSPLPDSVPQPANNPSTFERVDLGHMLFFETRLSQSNRVSCNTCHAVGAAGVDHRSASTADASGMEARNSPTVYNAAFLAAQFWDGRTSSLEDQAKSLIQTHAEMNLTPEEAVSRLVGTGYEPFFEEAFPDSDDPVTFENIARALAAFERTLVTPGSPFDRYLEGEDEALTVEQKEGLQLFQTLGCASCHNGPMLGGVGYARFSHVAGSEDTGRAALTAQSADRYVFRIAPLRNVALTYPYFHDGSASTLEEAVAVMSESQTQKVLSAQDRARIVAFLESLSGEFPQVPYPVLPR